MLWIRWRKRLRSKLTAALVLCIGASPSCSSSHEVRRGMNSPDALGRALAIREAAESNDRHSVPLLVDRLEDEDEAVRLFAIKALVKMTGSRLGYDYAKPADQRAGAVAQWREYVLAGRHMSPDAVEDEPPAAQAAADGNVSPDRVEQ